MISRPAEDAGALETFVEILTGAPRYSVRWVGIMGRMDRRGRRVGGWIDGWMDGWGGGLVGTRVYGCSTSGLRPYILEAAALRVAGEPGPRPEVLVQRISTQTPIACWWGPEDQAAPCMLSTCSVVVHAQPYVLSACSVHTLYTCTCACARCALSYFTRA